jgi:predicted dehydrogenase
MEQPLKIGIIGCGQVAESHLRGYQQNQILDFAFADVSPERAKAFAAKVTGASAFDSYTQLLEESGVQAISICTPPGIHREIAVAALNRGIHVLCEKPLAGTLEDCVAIEEAAQRSNAAFMMAFRHRFLPAHQTIKGLLQKDNSLGKIVLFQNIFGGPATDFKDKWFCNRAIAGGGVLLDTSIHGLDLFRFYCGEIQTSSGQARRTFCGTDVEDTGTLSVRAQSGALGLIASSWNIGTWIATVEIHTENARVIYDYNFPEEIVVKRKGVATDEKLAVTASDGFTEQIHHFLGSIKARTAPTPAAFDGRRSVEVITGVYSY